MLTKVCIVKAMIFLVVMHGCESWTIKQGERGELMLSNWCWSRLLRVPWTARGSNQSILKEINPEYSLEKLMLKFQYFGHLMRRTDSLEKTPIVYGHTTLNAPDLVWKRPRCWERLRAREEGGDRGQDGCMASLTQ